ncbi:MAG: hypothetical protein ACM3QX_03630 [Syntrophomonadaceae bacterium]
MKRAKNLMILLAAIFLVASAKLDAQINAGISMGRGGLNGFYMTVGNYFRVPQNEVIIVRDRRLPDEEIPVVFFVARRAGASPREVARLRRSGYSWMDITYQYGLGPEIFFPGRNFHAPRGRAYGYFRNHRGYYVSDYDIINAVNSRMISECYHCGENDVVTMRNQGKSYSQINDMYYGKGRGSDDRYDYHNRGNDNDNRNNDNGNNGNRDDNYGYGDPGNRN